jgi:hypothetical protein
MRELPPKVSRSPSVHEAVPRLPVVNRAAAWMCDSRPQDLPLDAVPGHGREARPLVALRSEIVDLVSAGTAS